MSIDYRKGDLKEPQPLILTDEAEPTFVLPNDKKILLIPRNTSILLACPGRNNSLQSLPGPAKQTVLAVCLSGKQFRVDSSVYEFSAFKCKVLPKETIKKSTSVCLEQYQRYDIGFTVNKHFLPLMEICRDDKSLRTYYSKAIIVKEMLGFQSSYPRPYWKYGSYYPGYNMNAIYKAQSQLLSLSHLLGSEERANEYIRPGVQYLNRGHLTAKADFVYGSQQSATLWLLNTAPQWASFNSGNWMIVESAVRRFASEHHLDLVVYTGVHGHTTLSDVNGNDQPLYLHANETGQAFAVPRFYWKVIYSPESNRATAFVGVNEPYAKNITKDMYLCQDIGTDPAFAWIGWQADNIEKGVSYVCAVEELRKAVPTVPYLGEIGVLV